MRSRLSNATLPGWEVERLSVPVVDPVLRIDAVFDEHGAAVGLVEYVRLPLRPRTRGVQYGWRPYRSGWTASRLGTRLDAVDALVDR